MTILNISQSAARTLYRAGNSAGHGYAPHSDVPGKDTIDAAVDAVCADGWEVIHPHRNFEDVAVLRNGNDEWMAIGGDARGNGAWAVMITDEFPSTRKLYALRDEAATAGDTDQVTLCEWAIGGDRGALLSCALVIADGQG